MAAVLLKISTISFIIAGLALVVAIYVAIKFNIRDVFNDLSGKTARSSIEKFRVNNEKSGVKSLKSSKVNVERGPLTDTISTAKNIGTGGIRRKSKNKPVTEPMTKHTSDSNVNVDSDFETGVIKENAADYNISEETGVLAENQQYTATVNIENETDVLDESVARPSRAKSNKTLEMIDEVILTHDN